MGPLGKKIKNILILKTDSTETRLTKIVVYTSLSFIFIMIFLAFLTFSIMFEKREIIKVPNVENISAVDAIVQLQKKHLNVKINAIYTDSVSDKGLVVNQKPIASKSVKEGFVVTLNVSKGVIVENVNNYTGWTVAEVENSLKGTDSLLFIQKPVMFIESEQTPGTVIKQYPIEGSDVSSKTELKLVVSAGEDKYKYEVKDYTDMNYIDVINELSNNNVPFNFEFVEGGVGSTVVSQNIRPETIIYKNNGISFEVTKPKTLESRYVADIITVDLPKYRGYVPIKVIKSSAVTSDSQYFSMRFIGGKLSFPIHAQAGTVFTVYADNEIVEEYVTSLTE